MDKKMILANQLRQQANKIESLDDDKLAISLLATCSALLKMNGILENEFHDKDQGEIAYAHSFAISNSIMSFCERFRSKFSFDLDQLLKDLSIQAEENKQLTRKCEKQKKDLASLRRKNEEKSEELRNNAASYNKALEEEKKLNDGLAEYSLEKIEEIKENVRILENRLENRKKELLEQTEDLETLKKDKEEVERKIAQIPDERQSILDEYITLKKRYDALCEAAQEYTPEKIKDTRTEIDRLTPIIERNKTEIGVLENQLFELQKQNTSYDKDRRKLTTNVTEIVSQAMTELKEVITEHEDFVDKTLDDARVFSESIKTLEETCERYQKWFDNERNPIEEMKGVMEQPEFNELRSGFNVLKVSQIDKLLKETENNLKELEKIHKAGIEAVLKDYAEINRRARG